MNGIFYIVMCVFGGLVFIIILVVVCLDIISNYWINMKDFDFWLLLNRKFGFLDWFCYWLGIWKIIWRVNRI